MQEAISPVTFEEWKNITKRSVENIVSEDSYLVSNLGRVYSNLRGRLLTPVITNNGYYRIALRLNNNTSRYFLIHRIVAIEFNFNEEYKNLQVDHGDGDKSNNVLANLTWCTGSENIIRAYQNGLKHQYHGEDCSFATITNEKAREVGKLLSLEQYTHKEISEITGVPLYIVDNISRGTTWVDVFKEFDLKSHMRKRNDYKFSDEQLHQLCSYFESHKNVNYEKQNDLFKEALSELFGIQYVNNMGSTLSRIYNHKTRKNITDQYDY